MTRTLLLFSGASLLLSAALSALGCSLAKSSDDPTRGTGASDAAGSGTGGISSGGAGGATGAGDPASKRWGSDGSLGVPETLPASNVDILPACVSGLTPLSFFMSADDSNSMASPALAREWLHASKPPPRPEQIRTYEFLNYYNPIYDLPDSASGKLGIHVDMMQEPPSTKDNAFRLRLQVGVQAFQLPRPELVLTYVIDTSGSLVGTGMERARAALLSIGSHLQKGDVVNVVTWANADNVLLEGYAAHGDPSDQDKLAEVVTSLVPGGGSDLHAGLGKGYDLAKKHRDDKKSTASSCSATAAPTWESPIETQLRLPRRRLRTTAFTSSVSASGLRTATPTLS